MGAGIAHTDPFLDARWGCRASDQASRINAARQLEHLFNMPLRTSPAGTGLALLRECLRQRGAIVPSPWEDKAPLITAIPLTFLRPDAANGYPHLHMLDRTAAYLNAAMASSVGLVPQHNAAPELQIDHYGLWRIGNVVLPDSTAYLSCLPHGKRPIWVPTPTIHHLMEMGIYPDRYRLEEARVWHTRHQLFREWAELLIKARALGGDAARASKRIANATIGMFAHKSTYVDVPPWWYRPDWRAHIVCTNSLTTARKAVALQDAGYGLVAAYDDMLCVASHEPDPPEILMARQTRVGGWRLVKSWSGSEMVRVLNLARARGNIASWLHVLDEVGRV